MLLTKINHACVLGMLATAGSAALAQTTSYPITQDTYIDSGVPMYNNGGNTKVKAVDDPASSMFPGSTSTTRALFYLPSSFWTALGNAISAGDSYDVTVNYYYGNNSLQGYSGGHVTGPEDEWRSVELHPMTTAWVPGTANDMANAAGSPGATWDTSNGTTPWTNTTPFPVTTYTAGGSTTVDYPNEGGDYDVANYVLDESGYANPASNGPFTWDITSLLSGGPGSTTYDELYNYGGLLKVNDDTTYDSANDIQYFLSMDSYESGAGTAPFVTLTIAPEPACIVPGMALLLLVGYNRRRK